jgi:endonuclease YncB( thermonuclease family)
MRHGPRPRRTKRGGDRRSFDLLDVISPIVVLAGLGLAWYYFNAPSRASGVSGYAMVIDGDTIDIQGRRIRLEGIDAPEGRQTCNREGAPEACGQIATNALAEIIGGAVIECWSKGEDQYDRMLGVCYRGDLDISGEMVRRGNAVAYKRYAWRNIPHELLARSKRRGIWATEFVSPERWRRSR